MQDALLRSIGRILLVRDQPASPCADSCIIREVGAEEKEEEEEEESEGKSGWTSCYCFSVVRADGSLPLIRGEGDGRRYFRKFFNLACRRTLLLLFYRRTHEDSTWPNLFLFDPVSSRAVGKMSPRHPRAVYAISKR